MHYRCSEHDGGDELEIEKNGGTSEGDNGPARCCGTMDGWVDGLLKYFCDMTMTWKLKCIGGYINIQFRNPIY
jgi:hypothetical protein